MGFRRLASAALAIVVAAIAYGVYAPDAVERWFPSFAPAATSAHAALFAANPAPTPASAAPANAAPAGALVSVAAVKRQDYPIVIEGLGQVQAFNTVTVRTRVDGQIEKIGFNEGQTVAAGDLIAQIDPRPYQAALDQATAKQAQDQANLANAKLDLQRYTTLAKQSFATQQQLDTQNALVSQLIAQIASDAAAIDSAQVQLDYTKIVAPISGRTGLRLVDQGNIVNAAQQTGIVSIAQLQPISVIFTAPQDDLPRIAAAVAQSAPKIEVTTSDGATVLATGKLTVIDNQVDATTGSIRLKAEFENKDDKLWPGLSVATRLTVGVDNGALVVPTEAVQHGPQGLFVYVVDDQNKAAMRPVTVSHQDATEATISKGVSEGDRVVTVGAYVLQPGARVSIDATPNSGS
jgi:multidrug efflux system membrane fusion protein